jgi:signal transduction histidine kinase
MFAPFERPRAGQVCAGRPAGFSWAGRFPRMARDDPTPVDLLEEIRAALDGVDPLLSGRVVDIEMSRLRVVTDPLLFRRVFAGLIAAAVAHTEPPDSITVRVARTGKSARIEVLNEGSRIAPDDLEDVTPEAEEFRAIGGEIGTAGPTGAATYWMSLPLAPGTSSAADG